MLFLELTTFCLGTDFGRTAGGGFDFPWTTGLVFKMLRFTADLELEFSY